jgi:predicted TIM-barrel fold metal-dependent hydrolase
LKTIRFLAFSGIKFDAMFPLITLEEHYVSAASKELPKDAFAKFPRAVMEKMECLDEKRIRDMDAGDVSLQVISHGPLDAPLSMCIKANDELAQAIYKNPNRLAGFAMLPMGEPTAAAAELARCVNDHGFVGTLVDNHLEGQFYDDERFWPVFEKAQELDVPVYIHPTFATDDMLQHYKGNYSDDVAAMLSAFGWGWHVETGLHILRLYASGLFDRFPKLKIIIGHMGELLPFQLARTYLQTGRWGRYERNFKEVWETNIWITTSGMFSLASLACLLETTSIEHVLYSVDYPFSTNERGKEFIAEIQKSGLMNSNELEMFAFKNAEKLLKVKAEHK